MKKYIAYLASSTLAILTGFGTIAIANSLTAPHSTALNHTVAVATEDAPFSITNALSSSDETVYVITDAAGTATKTFIGSDLYTKQKPLPVTLDITYYLNGSQISSSELAGQSGHIKIVYHYTATATYQDKLVPFLAVTGLQLDNAKFSNIKLNNGKIVSDKNNYTILGYGFAGLNENLGIDLLSDTFTIEADVTNFTLDNSYTFATNSILADLDTSKLSSVDDIVSSINQLSDGLDQIISGSTKLDSGFDSLVSGITKLQFGAETLNTGASSLASGASELATGGAALSNGLNNLNAGATELATGINNLTTHLNTLSDNGAVLNTYLDNAINATITQVNAAISTYGYTIDRTNYSTVLPTIIAMVPDEQKPALENAKNSLDLYLNLQNYIAGATTIAAGANQLNANVPTLTNGIAELNTGAAKLAAGAAELSSGADQLSSGTATLKNGIDTLASGSQQLSSGSKTLNSGLQTFKTSGIDRLTNFANNDLANLTANLRASVNAARSYHSYNNPSAKSVKFVFKTPSIKNSTQ